MDLEEVLNQPVHMINKKEIVCPLKNCGKYGVYYRCYLETYYKACKIKIISTDYSITIPFFQNNNNERRYKNE